MDRQPQNPYCCPVLCGGIPFILPPPILGEFPIQISHVFIAKCFGQDRGGGDRGKTSVTFYKAAVRDRLAEQRLPAAAMVRIKAVSVHQDKRGFRAELVQRPVHGRNGGPGCSSGQSPRQNIRQQPRKRLFPELPGGPRAVVFQSSFLNPAAIRG